MNKREKKILKNWAGWYGGYLTQEEREELRAALEILADEVAPEFIEAADKFLTFFDNLAAAYPAHGQARTLADAIQDRTHEARGKLFELIDWIYKV